MRGRCTVQWNSIRLLGEQASLQLQSYAALRIKNKWILAGDRQSFNRYSCFRTYLPTEEHHFASVLSGMGLVCIFSRYAYQ